MATIAELLEAANRKVQRGEETKALLKTRLTEKGLDVASENNFYNLADKVGEISGINFSIVDGTRSNRLKLDFPAHNFFLVAISEEGSASLSGLLFGLYTDNYNMAYAVAALGGANPTTFNVSISSGSTTISVSTASFFTSTQYIIGYW